MHNFEQSRDQSAAFADAPWWLELYRAAFPDMTGMDYIRKDGWAQRGGIDRIIRFASSKSLGVDEKVRSKVYPDFCLEYWSDVARKKRGWVAEDLACDYLAYAFVPTGICYLLPFHLLRRAWIEHHREWVDRYRRIEAENNWHGRYWTTVSVGVPIEIVLAALQHAMVVRFDNRTSPPLSNGSPRPASGGATAQTLLFGDLPLFSAVKQP